MILQHAYGYGYATRVYGIYGVLATRYSKIVLLRNVYLLQVYVANTTELVNPAYHSVRTVHVKQFLVLLLVKVHV